MYKLAENQPPNNNPAPFVIRTTDGACIPFDNANSDFTQFKKDLADGAELKDAEGVLMSAEQVASFVKTLP